MDKIVGKKKSYLAMKTDSLAANELISSDLKEIGIAVKKLGNHAVKLGSLGFGTSFLKWIASFAAIYLLILDRTNWKTNILTSLLIPYIFFSLPSLIFNLLRGEVGKWIALIAVVLRLFFPRHFPDWLELPGALIILIVVAPGFFCWHHKGQLDWDLDLSGHRMLFAARTYPIIGRVSEFIYEDTRAFQHRRDCPSVGISSLGTHTLHSLKPSRKYFSI